MRAKLQEKCEKINKTCQNSVLCHLHCTMILTLLQHESRSPLQHQFNHLTAWQIYRSSIQLFLFCLSHPINEKISLKAGCAVHRSPDHRFPSFRDAIFSFLYISVLKARHDSTSETHDATVSGQRFGLSCSDTAFLLNE